MAARKLFDPDSGKPFALSRSKVELYKDCPRCFYLDRRLGIARPAGFPFNLNSAVDALLKTEFDRYRKEGVKSGVAAKTRRKWGVLWPHLSKAHKPPARWRPPNTFPATAIPRLTHIAAYRSSMLTANAWIVWN